MPRSMDQEIVFPGSSTHSVVRSRTQITPSRASEPYGSPSEHWRQLIPLANQIDISKPSLVPVKNTTTSANYMLAHAKSTRLPRPFCPHTVSPHVGETENDHANGLRESVPRTLANDLSKLSLRGRFGPGTINPSKCTDSLDITPNRMQGTTPESGHIRLTSFSGECHRIQLIQAVGNSDHSTRPGWGYNPTGQPSGSSLSGGSGLEPNNEGSGDGPQGGGGGDGDGRKDGKNTKRARPPQGEPLGCPYRKRNKLRFNIRDHPKCTKPFKDFSLLKLHIRECHSRDDIHQCIRCGLRFRWPMEMAQHRKSACSSGYACNPRDLPIHPRDTPEDFEDGIAANIAIQLTDRTGQRKICTWMGLWGVLFPDDGHVLPSAYEAPVVMEPEEAVKIIEEDWLQAIEDVQVQIPGMAMEHAVATSSFFKGRHIECLRNFQPATTSRTPSAGAAAPPRRSRASRTKRGQGNLETSAEATPSQTPGGQQHGEPQGKFPALSRLAPTPRASPTAPTFSHSPSIRPYSAPQSSLMHQGPEPQTYAADGSRPLVNHRPQVWAVQTSDGISSIAVPVPIQRAYGLELITPLLSDYPNSSNSERQDHVGFDINYQDQHLILPDTYATAHRVPFPPNRLRQQNPQTTPQTDYDQYSAHPSGFHYSAQGSAGGWADRDLNQGGS